MTITSPTSIPSKPYAPVEALMSVCPAAVNTAPAKGAPVATSVTTPDISPAAPAFAHTVSEPALTVPSSKSCVI